MTQAEGTYENPDVAKDTTSTSKSERDIEAKQDSPVTDSATAQEADVDADQVQVLPGSGGPDDVGYSDVDPGELNLSGDSIPGHPKPEAGD